MLIFKNLQDTSIHEIVEAFNLGFSDYFVPITMTSEALQAKFDSEGIRLDFSVGVFDENKLVGFILHFYSELNGIKRVYNGGTAVLPKYRGQGLTQRMYEFSKSILLEGKINELVLEVVTINSFAINAYEKIGFKKVREVECYKGKIKPIAFENSNIQIEEIEMIPWSEIDKFWDFKPTWQNSIETMLKLQTKIKIIGAFDENRLIGYLVFNPSEKRIRQFAVVKEHRKKGVGSQLFSYVTTLEKDDVSLINLENIAYIKSFFEKVGLKNTVNQYEMIMRIN
ncbi:ribosomal-protein-alanine N-acetyltransferase [Flavobacterium columnare]|uniref:GNAT family N-acetyltransferase n=2 Tax=Flavobacterium TaxID=237 RepID=A0ABW8PRS9_9FLAO|nr:GNAT family N-acetyltransferase [Flavobacterium columnare]SPE76513.1 ribosomal-protein-alanine N-acetyltransferase [Flavobacterium columnare]